MDFEVPSGDISENNFPTRPFLTFLKNLRDCAINPRVQRGTTAQRPTRYIEPGFMFWDITINRLIIVDSVDPIIWKRADGVVA